MVSLSRPGYKQLASPPGVEYGNAFQLLATRFIDIVSEKILKAVDRLQAILPLRAQQSELGMEAARLYENLLTSFIEKGRVLNAQEIATLTGNNNSVIAELRAQSYEPGSLE